MTAEKLTADRIVEAGEEDEEEELRSYCPPRPASSTSPARPASATEPSTETIRAEPLARRPSSGRSAARPSTTPSSSPTCIGLAADAGEVVKTDVETLVDQLARIVAAGVADGAFAADDSRAAARAAFDATTRFHNPAHAAEWSDPQIDTEYEGVRALVLGGLTSFPGISPSTRKGKG